MYGKIYEEQHLKDKWNAFVIECSWHSVCTNVNGFITVLSVQQKEETNNKLCDKNNEEISVLTIVMSLCIIYSDLYSQIF